MLGLVFLLLASVAQALIISSPLSGSQIVKGTAFTLLVDLAGGESATQATVFFDNGATVYPVSVIISTPRSVVLPSTLTGAITLTAVATVGSGATVTSTIVVSAPCPYPNPYYPCYNPCFNPCIPRNPCYNPRPICNIPRNPCYNPRPVCKLPKPVCNIPRPRQNRCRIRAVESASESNDSFETTDPQVLYSGFSIYLADDAQKEALQQYEAELEHKMIEQLIKKLEEQEQQEQEQEEYKQQQEEQQHEQQEQQEEQQQQEQQEEQQQQEQEQQQQA
jgi:flagellar biosynthesis GTPase FlhF